MDINAFDGIKKASLVQREVARLAVTEGLFFCIFGNYNPSVGSADSSLYTREPSAAAGTVHS